MNKKNIISIALIALIFSSSAFAASGHGKHHHPSILDLKWYFFNFIAYSVILYFLVRKSIAKAWRERRESILMNVNKAQIELEKAQTIFAKAEQTAAAADSRAQALKTDLTSSIKIESESLIVDANRQAESIIKQSQQLAEAEKTAELNKVEKRLSLEVISKAEEFLKAEISSENDRSYRDKLKQSIKSFIVGQN